LALRAENDGSDDGGWRACVDRLRGAPVAHSFRQPPQTPAHPELNAVNSAPTPVLDEEALQRLCELDPGGQGHLLERVLRAFEASLLRLAPQLREARQRGDLQAVRHVAHTLKSSSASIGALRLSRLCAEIEAAVRQEAVEGLPALLDDVDQEFNVVLQAVQPLRGSPT
jgi:HPt (histidine-containing phosphotransfer) domain-containing protein